MALSTSLSEQMAGLIKAIKADVRSVRLATAIAFAPAGSIAATNVQAALQELDAEKATLNAVTPAIASIAALRLLLKTGPTLATVLGYYAPGDGGGGSYYLDAADTTTADNGGTVIVATDGGRWKLVLQGAVNVRHFGAKGDNIANDAPALQTAFNGGRKFSIAEGQFAFTTQIVVDHSAPAFPVPGVPSARIDIDGQSMANTILAFSGVGYAINLIGSDNAGAGQGIHAFDRIGGFTLLDKANAKTNSGIFVKNKAYFKYSDIYTQYMLTGLELQSCFTGKVENCYFNYGNYGLRLSQSGAAMGGINALVFDRVTFSGNALAGVLASNCQSANVFFGCTFEACGTMGNAGSGGWIGNVGGFAPAGYSGPLTFDTCYFESNKGLADISIDNLGTATLTVIIRGCIFNRAGNVNYTTNNITVTSSGGGRVIVQLQGNAFVSSPGYVPSAARPFFNGAGGKVEFVDLGGNSYSETTSLVVPFTSGRSWSGRVSSAGALIVGGNGLFTTSRLSAGLYRVTAASGAFAKSADGYVAIAVSNDIGGGVSVERVTQSTGSFDVVLTNVAGALTDSAFSFDIKLLNGV